MKALRIAVLWHQHQPYYRLGNEYILPWVRLHAVKDYFDLVELLHEFPEIKQTFNVVPSMLKQLDEYVNGIYEDKIQRLTKIPAEKLTKSEKNEILNSFFICNENNLIRPYDRYRELFEKRKNGAGTEEFSESEYRDLQVWYNLAWSGQISSRMNPLKRLFNKSRNFTEQEKFMLMRVQDDLMAAVAPKMLELMKLNQIELSVSPFYHPILPLLCNTDSAYESMPSLNIEKDVFSFPGDAVLQVEKTIKYFRGKFEVTPAGMWPSEGSISNESLKIISNSGIKWVASDEEILYRSVEGLSPTSKYYPVNYKNGDSDLYIFFRDRLLSDKIGFDYSTWYFKDSAANFIEELCRIREKIIQLDGEDALEHAIVPVILDGENCWEFYSENGFPFLRELYTRLTWDERFETVTFSEVLEKIDTEKIPKLNNIRAGSWINADFSIWIGGAEETEAWRMLARARNAAEESFSNLSSEKQEILTELLMIAEGSDWFWWYGDQHYAPNKRDFDVIFRWYLEQIYELCGIKAPDEVFVPVGDRITRITEPATIETYSKSMQLSDNSAMHKAGELLKAIDFGWDDEYINICFRTDRPMKADDKIIISNSEGYEAVITSQGIQMNKDTRFNFESGKNIKLSLDNTLASGIKCEIITAYGRREVSLD